MTVEGVAGEGTARGGTAVGGGESALCTDAVAIEKATSVAAQMNLMALSLTRPADRQAWQKIIVADRAACGVRGGW
jgi:hypothetical protein